MRAHTAACRLLIAAATTVMLGGCFSGGAETGGGNGDSDSEERLSVAMLQPPRSALTPYSDDAFKLSRLGIAETLVRLDTDGEQQPALAVEWSQVDELTWRFELRQDVTFHDGTPPDAQVVADSLTRATEASPVPRILNGTDLTVEADGDSAVLVSTTEVDPLLPQKLSSPQLSILAPAAYDGQSVDPTGTGTGPFELTELRGTSGATLQRYEDYWCGPAAAPGIDVAFVPDGTARAAALRTGEADIVEAIPVSQAPLLEPDTLREVPMPRTNTLYLNTEDGPFVDPQVRAAAREAIDRTVLVDGIYEGSADLAEGLLGPAIPWAAPGRPDREPASAGDAGGAITLATFTDRPELPEVAVALEQQLEAAGFVVELEVREYAQIEADALEGAFDAFILSRATQIDSGDPVAYLRSDFTCDGTFNLSQLCDPAVDAAIEDAARTADVEERRAAILEAEAAVLSTDAAIPLLHERVIQGVATDVEGAAYDPIERLLVTPETRIVP